MHQTENFIAGAVGHLLRACVAALPFGLLLSACSSAPAGNCQSIPGIDAICGFRNPEDIKRLPDQKTLLISQVGSFGKPKSSGSLVYFDSQSQSIRPAFPTVVTPNLSESGADINNKSTSSNIWGASNCPGMPGPEFSPLGISLQQRQDGRWQVAAVNQGQRMSVEMFELLKVGAHYGLEWRGCVAMPAEIAMNSVALLRSGGFVATHMFDRRAPSLFGFNISLWKSQLGFDTGYVFEWQPSHEKDLRILADSHGPFLNGIELSADEATVFFSVTLANQVRKLDRASGKLLGSVKLERPDNLAWDEQGFLLVASLTGSRLENWACIQHAGESCGMAFKITRVHPDNLRSEIVFAHEGAPMGAATVAQQMGDALYLGSFTGDRILKIAYLKKTFEDKETLLGK